MSSWGQDSTAADRVNPAEFATDTGGSDVKEIVYSVNGGTAIVTSGATATTTFSADGRYNVSHYARDNAGNDSAIQSLMSLIVKIDKTAPVITGSRSPGANANGWNNTDVIVTFNCTDTGGSGVASCSTSVVLQSEGMGQSVAGTVADAAGNSASTTITGINIDKTAPTISGSRAPAANGFGWNNTNVAVSFVCSDAGGSSIDTCSPNETVMTEGSGQSRTGTATDKAGNSASATVRGINIDKSPPIITGMPLSASCTLWPPDHRMVQVATVSARDALSGLLGGSFSVTGSSNEPDNGLGDGDKPGDIAITGVNPKMVMLRAERSGTGTGRIYSLAATAKDLGGNSTTLTSTCTVPYSQRK